MEWGARLHRLGQGQGHACYNLETGCFSEPAYAMAAGTGAVAAECVAAPLACIGQPPAAAAAAPATVGMEAGVRGAGGGMAEASRLLTFRLSPLVVWIVAPGGATGGMARQQSNTSTHTQAADTYK
jgi:hypothetical protein